MHIHDCCSQKPTSCPNPEPDESSPQPPIPFFVTHFNISRPYMFVCLSVLSNWLFPSGSPTKILYALFFSPTHATSLTHLILPYLDDDDDEHHHHHHNNDDKTMVVVVMIQTTEMQCMWDL
jgi:hypothetical protein